MNGMTIRQNRTVALFKKNVNKIFFLTSLFLKETRIKLLQHPFCSMICFQRQEELKEKFLKKQFNILSPPAHGESVMYVCDAGANYNRFVSDFNKWNYTITCTKNNTFVEEPDVPWPTCADGIKQKFFFTNIF